MLRAIAAAKKKNDGIDAGRHLSHSLNGISAFVAWIEGTTEVPQFLRPKPGQVNQPPLLLYPTLMHGDWVIHANVAGADRKEKALGTGYILPSDGNLPRPEEREGAMVRFVRRIRRFWGRGRRGAGGH